MNEAQAREAFFAGVLLCWVAGGERILRVIHLDQDSAAWVISATAGAWCLQVEGDTFVEAAEKLFEHASDRGFDDALLAGETPAEPAPETETAVERARRISDLFPDY